jgi:hypothetical protein
LFQDYINQQKKENQDGCLVHSEASMNLFYSFQSIGNDIFLLFGKLNKTGLIQPLQVDGNPVSVIY